MNIQEKVIKHLELQSGKGGITKVSSGEKETHYWSCLVSKGTEKWRKIIAFEEEKWKGLSVIHTLPFKTVFVYVHVQYFK